MVKVGSFGMLGLGERLSMSNGYGRIFWATQNEREPCKKKSNNLDRVHTVFDATLKIRDNYSHCPKIMQVLQWLY